MGVCLEPSNLCIITELAARGSLYDVYPKTKKQTTKQRIEKEKENKIVIDFIIDMVIRISLSLSKLKWHATPSEDFSSSILLVSSTEI